jgi:hypothetical protein
MIYDIPLSAERIRGVFFYVDLSLSSAVRDGCILLCSNLFLSSEDQLFILVISPPLSSEDKDRIESRRHPMGNVIFC